MVIWVKNVMSFGIVDSRSISSKRSSRMAFQLIDPGLIVLPLRIGDVGHGDRIKIVVRQGNEAEAAAAQLDDLLDNANGSALTGTLSIGAPYGTKRAVFGASAHSLHRRPHIAVSRQQIPSGWLEVPRFHSSAVIDPLRSAGHAVMNYFVPDDVAIALHHRVRAAVLKRLLRIERGMDSPEHNPGAALACRAADFVSSQCVAGVNADTDDVAGLNTLQVEVFQSFIADFGIAERLVGRSGEHVQPSRRDDCRAERSIAGIDEVDAHGRPLGATPV